MKKTLNLLFVFHGFLFVLTLVLVVVFMISSCSGAVPAESPTPAPTEPVASVPKDDSNQAVILTPEPEETQMPYVIVTPTPSVYDFVKPQKHAPAAQSEHQTLAMEIFHLTNEVREEGGLNRLTYAYDLQDAADTRAYECSIQFSHTRPDGTSCHDIVTRDYYVTGENLILADKPIADAETLMARWMLSKGHRDNIMLPEFTELAVGVYEKNDTVFATQIFIG